MRSLLNELWKLGQGVSQGVRRFDEIVFWIGVPLLSFVSVRVLSQSLPGEVRNGDWITSVAEVLLFALFLYTVRHFFRTRTLHWQFILRLLAVGGVLLMTIY